MIDKIITYFNRYTHYKARTTLLDFASLHIDDLSVGEIAKIMEVVNLIREYEKVDNKSNP